VITDLLFLSLPQTPFTQYTYGAILLVCYTEVHRATDVPWASLIRKFSNLSRRPLLASGKFTVVRQISQFICSSP